MAMAGWLSAALAVIGAVSLTVMALRYRRVHRTLAVTVIPPAPRPAVIVRSDHRDVVVLMPRHRRPRQEHAELTA
jgi:hypothetical protein